MFGKMIFSIAVFLVAGCQSNFTNEDLPADTTVIPASKLAIPVNEAVTGKDGAVPRDRTINESNGYNDIFLDSLDVERFIVKQKLNDTVAIAIRAFYNVRNDEYAWFSSAGLIEQSVSFRSLYSSENDVDLFNKSLEDRLDGLRTGTGANVRAKDPSIIETNYKLPKGLSNTRKRIMRIWVLH